MCGIAGLLGPSGDDVGSRRAALESMAGCLEHRGPDASGTYQDGPIGLAHRRLAVLGLGEAGAQPMTSASGRYVTVYNGEIYNHPALRTELERSGRAPTWRGSSDTETLLAGVEAWGLDGLLERSVGMFAFALWDRDRNVLTLVRDRMGEKPLYWAIHDRTLLFASQPSALRRFRGFTPTIDPDALADLLRYAQVPGPRTIHREVRTLLPGTLLEVHLDANGAVTAAPEPKTWWSFTAKAQEGRSDPIEGGDEELVDTIGDALTTSVRGQLLSDVPLGAFLSGGIDSSLVVATMQAISTEPVRTFTIGFAEDGYDESPHARAIAAHLGTDHTELMLSASDALAIVPDLASIYDEPFADSSQLPTVLVSRLARRSVTVALSGDGGDELFGGYDRYVRAARLHRTPRPVAVAAAAAYTLLGQRRKRDAALSLGRGSAVMARRLLSAGTSAERLVLGVDQHAARRRFDDRWAETAGLGDLTARFMALDTTGYLPDDILHKVDRAAMSVSLETRIPLLDHRLVELAWRLPETARARAGQPKWILRELLARSVPRGLFERPKSGFGIPVGQWLRGPLRPWAADLLSPEALRRDGLLDERRVRDLWERHVSGREDSGHELWPILMFQAWSGTTR